MLLPHQDNSFQIFQVGCGGTGSFLTPPLARYLSHESGLAGRAKLTLIDGDILEFKNLKRQNFSENVVATPKSVATAELIKQNLGMSLNVELDAKFSYLTHENISELLADNSTILLCPDNARCRVLVEKWALETCKNVVVISAGNDFDDGQVQVMIIKDGELITPTFTKCYPELLEVAEKEEDITKRVKAHGCEVQAAASPQLIVANVFAATLVLSYIHALVGETIDSFGSIFDTKIAGAFPSIFQDKDSAKKLRAHASKAVSFDISTAAEG